MTPPRSLHSALDTFASIHASDPREVTVHGSRMTHSQRYHQALQRWVDKLDPAASDALKLAAASQHLRRWAVPRDSYPMGRAGYKKWRTDLLRRHADEAAEVMTRAGLDADTVAQVRALITKDNLRNDPDMQLFEDAICLAFLECELLEFAAGQSQEKLARILRKTWRKMTDSGQQHARQLLASLPEAAQPTLQQVIQLAGL